MKRIYTILVAVLLTASVFAQAPQKMTYQAVVRDDNSTLITSTQVGIEINIYQGSTTGTLVYTETQTPTTNENGLLTIEIGGQTGFDTITWANGPYFLETNIDITGGSTYTITGVSQLLTVPYALHAKTAETITGGITETDPVFTAWDKSTGISITESQITDLQHFTNADETDPIYSAWNKSYNDLTNTPNITDTVNAVLDTTTQFVRTETDPVFTAWDKSTGVSITESQITDLQHFTNADETDPVYSSSQAANITATDITNLSNLSGTNTGDQQISRTGLTVTLTNGGTYQDSVNTYTAGTGIDITNNVISKTKPKFYLGQDTLGGIVYHIYLDANGEQHGLIVSKTETTAKWQNTGVLVNADRTEDGIYNMNLMSDSPAKNWVTTNFDVNWYLPSIDELSLLWHNRFYANKALRAGGFTLLAYNAYYWSSTEYIATHAFYFNFAYGYSGYNNKPGTCSVRSVRAF